MKPSRFILFIGFMVFTISLCNAQSDLKYSNYHSSFILSGNSISIETNNNDIEVIPIKRIHDNYLSLSSSSDGNWLFLISRIFLVAYKDGSDKPYFVGFSGVSLRKGFEAIFPLGESVESTSELLEGDIRYSIKNINSISLESPWVEGVDGYGVGEKIKASNIYCKELIISSGYVSITNPHLYEQNSRPKKVTIRDLTFGSEVIVDLLDTPNPQFIDLGDLKKRDIEIEIVEVYKGTKYKDTCINFILAKAW